MIFPRSLSLLAVATFALALASCGAGQQTGNGSSSDNKPVSLSVSPSVVLPLPQGLNQQFAASANYSDGTGSDVSDGVTWTTSDSSVATVDSTGTVTAQSPGTATITASYDGVSSDGTSLTVTTATLQSLSLQLGTPSLANGLTTSLTVYGNYSDGTSAQISTGVSFSSGTGSVASVSASGVVTALGVGSSVITASYGGQTATATVGVTTATLSSIVLHAGSGSIAAGLTTALTVDGVYTDGTSVQLSSGVSFSSSAPSIASVNANGVVTALGVGSSTITATYGGSLTATTTVGVTAALLQSLSLQTASGSLIAGLTTQLTVYGNYSDGSSVALSSGVTFSSSSLSLATVTNLGIVTGVGAGSATLTASYGGKSATTVIAVSAPSLVSIDLSIGTGSLAAGLTTQLTAIGHYDNGDTATLGSGSGVFFTVDSTGSGKVGITAGGLVSALAATTGSASITASLGGVTSNAVSLSVTSAVLQSIAINPVSTIIAGLTGQITVTGTYSDSSTATIPASSISFSTSNAGLATVNSSGTILGIAVGSPTITATVGGLSDTATVTIAAPTLTSISVSPASATLVILHSLQLTVTAHYDNGSDVDVTNNATYSSSNTGLLSITIHGLLNALSTLLPGSVTATATYGGQTATSTISITLL